MVTILSVKGPNFNHQFTLGQAPVFIGRDPNLGIPLNSATVSRRHAKISWQGDTYVVEDLGSRNGTFLNDMALLAPIAFSEQDQLRVGEFVLTLVPPPRPVQQMKDKVVVREQVAVASSNTTLYAAQPEKKLQAVLELSQALSLTLERDLLLNKLLDHLLVLFPQADQGMVIHCEQDRLILAAQRQRRRPDEDSLSFSRTIVNQALKEGVGILSEDVRSDQRFASSGTISALDVQSLLCVPLIAHDGRRLGAIQLACSSQSASFHGEDLRLLTTVSLQLAVVLENVELNAQRLREVQIRQELARAREIQESFLPTDFTPLPGGGYDLFGRVFPAQEVSGDLYDFFPAGDGRLAFFVGDVAGKGMPAALFMFAVRSLGRHLARAVPGPAEVLCQLNTALAIDNPSTMFVTLIHGLFDPRTGEVVLASGGHLPPLLHRANGRIEEVPVPPCRMLGYEVGDFNPVDVRLTLAPGETLILYTDGCTEVFAPDGDTMFGLERLQQVLVNSPRDRPLQLWADRLRQAVEKFSHSPELQDDLTLWLLRRP